MNKSIINSISPDFLQEEKPFDLKRFLYQYLFRYWYLYVIALGLAMAGSKLYLRYTVPIYEVKSKLLIRNSGAEGAYSEEALLKGLGYNQSSKNLSNEIEILKSRTLMEEVVDSLGLYISWFSEGRVLNNEYYGFVPFKLDSFNLNEEAYSKIFTIRLTADKNKFEFGREEVFHTCQFGVPFTTEMGTFQISTNFGKREPSSNFLLRIDHPQSVAGSYAERLKINPVQSWADVLELSLRDPVPAKAKDILNTLVTIYNKAGIEDKNKVSENTLEFIDERLLFLTGELSEVEGEVEKYKQKNDIATEANANLNLLFTEVQQYDQQLTNFQLQRNVLEEIERYLNNDANFYELIPFNTGLNNGNLSQQVRNYNDLVLERNRLLKSGTSNNPVVLGVEEQIINLRSTIQSSLRNIKNELNANIKVLENKSKQRLSNIRTTPRKERELLEIKRQQSIKENLYLYLLQKREETALSLAVTVPNSRLIDPASGGSRPISPRRLSIYGIAFLLGLVVPIGFIVIQDLLNDTIQSEEEIKNQTAMPIIGGISYNRSGENIVVSRTSRTNIAEMFRLLRTNLQFMASNKEQKTILITSGTSGEGKSFISVNLSYTLALSNKKTLVIGFDLRKPKLTKYLVDNRPNIGITNYLVGQNTIEEIIQSTELSPNLFYIGSGPIPPNPAELVMGEKIQEFFQIAREQFDYIIIDTPPIGLVTDALLLNKFADISLVVVRHGATKKQMLSLLEEIYQEKRLNKPAIVFNAVKKGGGYGYEYNGYGYGGYGGYGYYEDMKSSSRWKWWKKKKVKA